MKKLFVSVLAIASMVACMNDEIVSVQKGNPIAFDSFVENVTRVGYDSDSLDGFDVWAFMDNTDGVILADEDVEKDGQGKYSYTNTQYWLPGHTYYFAALAPMESANVTETLATGDDALKGLGTVTFTNVDGTEDLLYAATSVVANDNQGPVNFQFNHLLSKVKFSFTNTFKNDRYSFEVCDIEMTAPKVGTIDLTEGEYAWDILDGVTTLAYGDTGKATKKTQETATVSSAYERLTIPADANQEYIVTFVVKLYVNDIAEPAMVYNKKTKISGLALEAGKAYKFAANIDAATLALDEIVFDAEVDEWGTGTGAPQFTPYFVEVAGVNYDNFAEAVAVAMELGAPVKFFQHVVIDADDTILVPAGKTLSLELNGYTLTGVTDQTGSNRDMFTVKGTMNVNGAPLTRAAAEGNGCINIKHIGTDMEWSNCTDIFRVLGNGVLELDGVTAKNLGGTNMAYVVDMSNASDLSVTVKNSTLESTYIPVRLFNNMGKHTVTIENTSLTGKKCCVWVQYGVADGRDQATLDETVILNVYNPTQNNTFTYTGAGPVLYGFNEDVFFDAYGNKLIADGVGYDEAEKTYTVSTAEGQQWIAEQVDNGKTFAGETVKLIADLDFTGTEYNPIGDNRKDDAAFSGIFDGQNHTIKGSAKSSFDGSQYGSKEGWGLFSVLDGATVKNLKVDGATFGSYTVISGTIAGYANNTTFENIDITNTKIAGYNWYSGGVVGWAQGECTFKDINLDDTVYVGTLWDSHGQNAGGIAGGVSSSSKITIEDCNIACVMDVINDITSNYKWCLYRVSGMIIGNTNTTEEKYQEVVTAAATNVTCKNVTVTYGDWMNYHYCEGYWNRGWGRYESSDYVGGVDQDEPHNHADGEDHFVTIPFDQLFGGGSNGSGHYPVKGLAEFPGVTVNYPASYRREVSTAAALTEALGKGVSVILDADIDLGSTQLAITGKNQVVDLNGKALTTANNWGGISLKNGATIKNGTITHTGNTAAIKAFNGTSVENVTINATCATADKTVTGIAVQQGANVESIKNVTIKGVSQGIEVGYQATVGLIKNAVVNEENNGTAKGIALVINGGKVGKAKDCTFKGKTYGITMHLKGVFAVGLELENCEVEGTTASIYAWDEKGISNTSGSFVLKYDSATVFTGAEVYDFEDECKGVVTINGAKLQ